MPPRQRGSERPVHLFTHTHTIINSEPGALSHTDLSFLAKNTLECVVHDMAHKSITLSTQLLGSVIRFLGSSDMIWNTDTCSRLILLTVGSPHLQRHNPTLLLLPLSVAFILDWLCIELTK